MSGPSGRHSAHRHHVRRRRARIGHAARALEEGIARVVVNGEAEQDGDPREPGEERREVRRARAQRGRRRAVEPRQEHEVARRDGRHAHRAGNLHRPVEVLEELKERQEVPLRARRIVAHRIGRSVERRPVLAQREQEDHAEDGHRGGEVHAELPREEAVESCAVGARAAA